MNGSKIKISDVVIETLVKNGIDHIFGVTGGAVVHLFDSAEKNEEMRPIFFNHEQAASFALEAYAKTKKGLGAGIFTTGPGATNALTGLAAAWLDSIPCVFLSGQARSNQTINGRKLRQVGTQEIDIISMVDSKTNYAVTTYDLTKVKYELDKAIYLSKRGRPGPVWVDIPVDIQWSFIEPEKLVEFDPRKEFPEDFANEAKSYPEVETVARLLEQSQRPLLVVGNGVRLGGAEAQTLEFIEKFKIPFLTSWSVADFTSSDHPLNVGKPGMAGQRGANLAMQNCDLLLSLGSHMNTSMTGTLYAAFARGAKKVVVDIDQNELDYCGFEVDLPVQADAGRFISQLADHAKAQEHQWQAWRAHCDLYQAHNRIALAYKDQPEKVNSYYFKDLLSDYTKSDDIYVVDGGGTVVYSAFQSSRLKDQQRLVLSTGLCSMGSGLPEAIGASFAAPGSRVILFCGDGSLPFNMQELQTIKNYKVPMKIFIFNNEGYVSIRTTQKDFLEESYVGSTPESGLSLLNTKKVAEAFDFEYVHLDSHSELSKNLADIMSDDRSLICEVIVSAEQEIVPRQGFKKEANGMFAPRPLEDMYPYLERDEFEKLMLIPEWNSLSGLGKEVNLLKNYPKSSRPVEERGERKLSGSGYIKIPDSQNNEEIFFEQLLLERARKFDQVYFDGDRLFGYGGYHYDTKFWDQVAKDIIEHYDLKAGDKVLDVGCAKGFLLYDLQRNLPGLEVSGIDISEYAISSAPEEVRTHLRVGNAISLPFEDDSFDLVLSINTLSELHGEEVEKALSEIERVSKGRSFVTVNSWRNNREKKNLFKWNVTAPSNYSVETWKTLFHKNEFHGDYYWFTLE